MVEDEGVIFEQRQRIGGEFVEQRITQNQRRLRTAWTLLLPKNVGDIVSAESVSRGCFFNRVGNGFGSVLTDEFEQFSQLTRECAVGVGDIAQIRFHHGLGTETIEKQEQALLRAGPAGRGTQLGYFRFNRSAPKVWPRRHERG